MLQLAVVVVVGKVLLVWSRLKHSAQLYVYRDLVLPKQQRHNTEQQNSASHETQPDLACAEITNKAELGPGIPER